MQPLTSWEEYKNLLSQAHMYGLNMFSNFYLDREAIKRYIALKRIDYEMNENKFCLYTDEENYYRLYLQCNEKQIDFSKRDKPILVRNVYRDGGKSTVQQGVEQQLCNQGFVLYDESVQILAHPLEDKENILKKSEKTEKFLGRFSLKIIYANDTQLKDIYFLRDHTPELKPFHFFYETPEEKKTAIENGWYRCVVNEEDKICAAQQFSVENNGIQGNWLAVEAEYQEKYGIGAAMAYHSFAYAIERGIKNYFGWVVRNNTRSIKYHQSIGYEITDKVADEWILM